MDRATKSWVTKRVQLLAKITKMAYELDYNATYGGYTLRVWKHSTADISSGLSRLSGKEMVAFIDGMIAMFEYQERVK